VLLKYYNQENDGESERRLGRDKIHLAVLTSFFTSAAGRGKSAKLIAVPVLIKLYWTLVSLSQCLLESNWWSRSRHGFTCDGKPKFVE